jgi:N-acyl-D-aspartate/D-glutamate deacylase
MLGPAAQARSEALAPLGIGIDWTDLTGYFRRFSQSRCAMNLGTYVGAAQVRVAVLGMSDGQPTDEQLKEMRALTERAMQQGAFGISNALEYAPGTYTHTREIIALAEVAARYGGVYATHLRDQSDRVLEAIDEALAVGRAAHVPVQIWHLKVMGRRNWGRMRAVLDRLERARAEGLDVRASVYPYTASANGFDYYMPAWAQEGGPDAMIRRVREPEARARIVREMEKESLVAHPPEDVLFAGPGEGPMKDWLGKRVSEIAAAQTKSAAEVILDIVAATHDDAMAIEFSVSEADLRLAMQTPWITIDTDYAAAAVDGPLARGSTHPRAFATTARILGHYVRDEHVLSLEEAVRRLTALPASQLGLGDRGLIKTGLRADLVVLRPDAVRDEATYEVPNRYPTGIDYVLVGGQVVLDHGTISDNRPGEPVEHPSLERQRRDAR